MWLLCSEKEDGLPRIVIYSYRPTRAGENAKELLEGFEGHYLVCDGYQGYNKVSGVVRCSCLAHIRRKFNDAIPKEFMEHYLLDGRIEISNQIAENAVRPFAVGRRNWLFSNSVSGAIASAAFYSLIETAKINGLRIRPYLTEVLTVMRNHANGSGRIDIEELLPWSETMQSKFSATTKQNLKEITYEDLKNLQ